MQQVSVVWATVPRHASAAYDLLETAVARVCGVGRRDVRLARMCSTCGSSEHGRPYVVPSAQFTAPHVSLSRAGDLAIVAVTHAGPVGVDIEQADGPSFVGFDDVALHPGEEISSVRGRAITWVRKESLLKAMGVGLMVDPRRVRLTEPGQPPQLLEWTAAGGPLDGVWMYDAAVRSSHVAGVCVLSRERPELNVREAVREGSRPRASS